MDYTSAERQRRYIQRLKDAATKGVTNATDTAEMAALRQELKQAKTRIKQLEAERAPPATEQARSTAKPLYTPPPPSETNPEQPMQHDEQQQIVRLRALWKSGRDKYQSFFVTLNEVRHDVGDSKLDEWCYSKLLIGLEAITRVAGVLKAADAAIVKRTFADAKQAEKERRAAARKRPR